MKIVGWLMCVVSVLGCGDDVPMMDVGPGDAGNDAGPLDVGTDAVADGSRDVGLDSGPADSGPDVFDAGHDGGPDAGPPLPFGVSSTAFGSNEEIPQMYRCDGENISPPLAWTPGPRGTLSYALVMKDVSARSLVHWAIYNIPGDVLELPEGVELGYEPANVEGALQVEILLHSMFGYYGPCSGGRSNRYRWLIHAMPTESLEGADMSMTANQIVALIEDQAITRQSFVGIF